MIPRSALLTIYKTLIRTHLYYGDTIYDQLSNASFSDKIESVQFNAALANTEATKGTSRVKLYRELRLEKLNSRRWTRHHFHYYKLLLHISFSYLCSNITQPKSNIQEVPLREIPRLRLGQLLFEILFFPKVNMNDTNICSSASLTTNVPRHIETSQLICNVNQLTDFYLMGDIGR